MKENRMTYIAKEPLFVGTARAHNPGDVVPDENVKANGWEDSVVKEGTKAAQKALDEVLPEPLPTSAQAPNKK
jgi:hypothetical protein